MQLARPDLKLRGALKPRLIAGTTAIGTFSSPRTRVRTSLSTSHCFSKEAILLLQGTLFRYSVWIAGQVSRECSPFVRWSFNGAQGFGKHLCGCLFPGCVRKVLISEQLLRRLASFPLKKSCVHNHCASSVVTFINNLQRRERQRF